MAWACPAPNTGPPARRLEAEGTSSGANWLHAPAHCSIRPAKSPPWGTPEVMGPFARPSNLAGSSKLAGRRSKHLLYCRRARSHVGRLRPHSGRFRPILVRFRKPVMGRPTPGLDLSMGGVDQLWGWCRQALGEVHQSWGWFRPTLHEVDELWGCIFLSSGASHNEWSHQRWLCIPTSPNGMRHHFDPMRPCQSARTFQPTASSHTHTPLGMFGDSREVGPAAAPMPEMIHFGLGRGGFCRDMKALAKMRCHFTIYLLPNLSSMPAASILNHYFKPVHTLPQLPILCPTSPCTPCTLRPSPNIANYSLA